MLYSTIVKIPNKIYSIVGFDNKKYEKKLVTKNSKENEYFIKKANKYINKNRFSYVFEKTMIYTYNEVSEVEKTLRIVLSSKQFISYIKKITNINVSKLNSMFLSRYKSGHFLSPHSDINNGKLAFVINLSKNWLPQFGGNLIFLSDDRKTVIHTLTPVFNNIIIFEVPPQGIHHYVSRVIPRLNNVRYALTGWYE